ncbi:TetR/AcrR family transcriptional regulator [Aeromicrobium sp. Leaf350]|uniref:TetR/AcrR family transcriptional regulator n=1 Tax=Aeromicrobium sp. Leaf350 TaxID=2876565 RepID=UPI001E42C269|nr:TetR/AcrR family transcriptional regulator [Aeromicrobium sp. Leaf350]
MPPRPPVPDGNQRREARRQLLLDSSLELFATRGYLASPIEDLCRAAHVSTKSFYGIYTSREDCYLDLMRRTTDAMLSVMSEAVEQESFEDVTAAEHRLLAVFAHEMGDDPRVAAVLFGRGAATTFTVESHRRLHRRRTADLLDLAWRLGGATPPQPEGVATGVAGAFFHIVSDWVEGAERLEDLETDELLTRLLAFYEVAAAGIRRPGLS